MKKKIIVAMSVILGLVLTINSNNITVKANDIEDNKTCNVSSSELLEKVLNNKELDDIVFYNSPDEMLIVAKDNIEEFEELVNRPDYVETVIAYYDNYKLADDYATDDEVFGSIGSSEDNLNSAIEEALDSEDVAKDIAIDIEEASRVFFLEELLTSVELLSEANKDDMELISEVTYEKFTEKMNSEFHKDNLDNIYERALEKNVDYVYNVDEFNEVASKVRENKGDKGVDAKVKTPDGTTVNVIIYKYFGDKMSKLLTLKTKIEYPDAEILEPADNRYNCHSYAWYQADKNNRYWMNRPIAYLIDGSYEKTTEIKPGNRVVWSYYEMKRIAFVEHSGVVESVDGDKVVIVSKWGEGPLMRHDVTYSPYTKKIEYYK